MDLEHLIELILPPIIGVLEMMGIFVVAVSAVRAFAEYLGNTFLHRHYALQFELADGLATGLEFKMAAEILKTVLVREMSELLILGAVIILRALLSLLIHFELKSSQTRTEESLKEMIQNAVDAIRAVAGARPSVGLILGSGWAVWPMCWRMRLLWNTPPFPAFPFPPRGARGTFCAGPSGRARRRVHAGAFSFL